MQLERPPDGWSLIILPGPRTFDHWHVVDLLKGQGPGDGLQRLGKEVIGDDEAREESHGAGLVNRKEHR